MAAPLSALMHQQSNALIMYSRPDHSWSYRRMLGLCVAMLALCTAQISAATINWGNAFGDLLVDSNGDPLDGSYTFQLGAFDTSFTPTDLNRDQWFANWRVFDQASFNPTFGYFTGTAQLQSGGTSNSTIAGVENPSFNFANLNAYIFIFNQESIVVGETEWFLARNTSWVFPPAPPLDCCDTTVVEFAVSDLIAGDTPLYGGQSNVTGPGTYTERVDTSVIQTFTFPETTNL